MHHFCTYFDHNYLPRGLTLHQSLSRYCPEFTLHVLCLSDECHDLLTEENFPSIIPVRLEELEQQMPKLLTAKSNRNLIEYYFTLTPFLSLFILQKYPEIEMITYLDSDLYFFHDPQSIFDEMSDDSVGIIRHRYHPSAAHLNAYGLYNVGWISYRNDPTGLAVLQWYANKCLEWCYDRLEENRYADQKYLDFFVEKFERVRDISHRGANLAPWNVNNYTVQESGGQVFVDESPLIFFHVQGLKKIWNHIYDPGFCKYGAVITPVIRNFIYLPYIRDFEQLVAHYRERIPTKNLGGIRPDQGVTRYDFLKKLSPRLFRFLAKMKHLVILFRTHTFIRS